MKSGESNKTSFPEWYLLRVTNQFDPESKLSLLLFGGLSEREKEVSQIRKEAEKALRAGYKKVLLPWNFLQHRDFQNLKSLILLTLTLSKKTLRYFQVLRRKGCHGKS